MKTIVKMALAVMLLIVASTDISAQGFLKKVTKAVDKAGKTLGVAETLADTAKVEKSKMDSLLVTPMKFEIKQITLRDETGDTLNADGTVRYSYRVVDENDKVYDPDVVEQMVNSRTKAYMKILAKVGIGAGVGSVKGILSKNKKEALTGAAIGAATGLALSATDIAEIRKINEDLKQLKARLESYKQTFTAEGLPKDAAIDLTNVNGIDFTQCPKISKPMAEVQAELEASKNMEIPNLDELNI